MSRLTAVTIIFAIYIFLVYDLDMNDEEERVAMFSISAHHALIALLLYFVI